MLVSLLHKVFGLEFQQLIDLTAHVVHCVKRFRFKIFKSVVLHLHVADLMKLFVQLLMEGMEDGGLEGECAAADGEDAG